MYRGKDRYLADPWLSLLRRFAGAVGVSLAELIEEPKKAKK
jgi:hypothetical protein